MLRRLCRFLYASRRLLGALATLILASEPLTRCFGDRLQAALADLAGLAPIHSVAHRQSRAAIVAFWVVHSMDLAQAAIVRSVHDGLHKALNISVTDKLATRSWGFAFDLKLAKAFSDDPATRFAPTSLRARST